MCFCGFVAIFLVFIQFESFDENALIWLKHVGWVTLLVVTLFL